MILTLRRKEAELRLRLLHRSKFSFERLSAEQTVPDMETTATLIKNATNNVNLLSIKKYRHAS